MRDERRQEPRPHDTVEHREVAAADETSRRQRHRFGDHVVLVVRLGKPRWDGAGREEPEESVTLDEHARRHGCGEQRGHRRLAGPRRSGHDQQRPVRSHRPHRRSVPLSPSPPALNSVTAPRRSVTQISVCVRISGGQVTANRDANVDWTGAPAGRGVSGAGRRGTGRRLRRRRRSAIGTASIPRGGRPWGRR